MLTVLKVKSYSLQVTFARVNRTLILCQSPSNEAPLALEFAVERTKDTTIHSLSLPCNKLNSSALADHAETFVKLLERTPCYRND